MFLFRIRELRITSEKCFVMVLWLSTYLIIWMQNFFSPSENLGLNTTKKQSPYLSSKVIPSAKAGIFPEVKLILPSICPVPSVKRNMFELFSLLKFSSLPTMLTVQKLWPSKVESSLSWWVIWQSVRGMMALSLTGLQSFLAEYAICRLLKLQHIWSKNDFKQYFSGHIYNKPLHFQKKPTLEKDPFSHHCKINTPVVKQVFQHRNMQTSTPRNDNSARERPLQNSMFLPGSQSQQSMAPQRTQTIDTMALSSMKRSSLLMLENSPSPVSPSFHYNQNHINFQHNKQVQSLNFSSNYSPEVRTHSHHELVNSNGPASNVRPINPSSQSENELRNFIRNGKNIPESQFNQDSANPPIQQVSLASQIIETIKDKYFNQWLSPLRKDLTDQINAIKAEVLSMRSEMALQKSQQACLCKQIKSELAKLSDSKTSYTNPANSKIKRDSDVHEWQKQLQMATERIGQLQNKFGDSLNKLICQLQKIAQKDEAEDRKPRASVLRSSLPPVVLEYRESFVIQRSVDSMGDEEVVFTSELYFVDKHGYLMDGQNRYLVDSKNRQIRLEQKHLSMLEQHKILQK